MKTKTQQIYIVVATLAMITTNALANIIPFNGITTNVVSDRIKSYFVPAGYVFSIWGVIYLALLAFSFGYTIVAEKKRAYVKEITPLYLFTCFLNAIWLILWHYGFFLTSVVVMVTLLVTLIMIYQILQKNPPEKEKEKIFIHLPFSIYLAWICVATIANISGVMWLLNWNALGLQGYIWSAIMMIIAGGLAVTTTLVRKDMAFSLVIIWALIGIMIKFPEQKTMLYAGSIAVGAIVVTWVYITLSYVRKLNKK